MIKRVSPAPNENISLFIDENNENMKDKS